MLDRAEVVPASHCTALLADRVWRWTQDSSAKVGTICTETIQAAVPKMQQRKVRGPGTQTDSLPDVRLGPVCGLTYTHVLGAK